MKNAAPGKKAPREDGLDNRQLLAALRGLRRGEFSVRLPDELTGVDGQICETFNELAQFAGSLRQEIVDLRQSVGREGRTHRRLGQGGAKGGWADYIVGVNELLEDVTAHTGDVARVLTAVAKGDLGQAIDVEGKDAPCAATSSATPAWSTAWCRSWRPSRPR